MAVKDQKIMKQYAMYCGDCIQVLPNIKDESIGFSVFSPPFAKLYSYSDENEDMSNAKDYEQFFDHFRYLVKELLRVSMPGRIVAVHCMDLPTYKRDGEEIGVRDFPGDIIRCFVDEGFIYHCPRITIWKDPLVAAVRTKALNLAHQQIVKDSSRCAVGIPDCIVAFRKPGENPKPIGHPVGLTEYHGKRTIPDNLESFAGWEGRQGENKRSQWIWQRYASPVWDDIRQTRVLPFRGAREEDDESHICPLQLDVVERCMVLWSTSGDVVLTPFAGVGTEVYVAVKNGRKAIGIELKSRYYRQAVKNCDYAIRKYQGHGIKGVET